MKNPPISQVYHPLTAALFACVLIVAAYSSPNLPVSLVVAGAASIVSFSLITSRQSRKTFVWVICSCAFFSFIRLGLIAITTTTESSSVNFPQLTFPSWLGSIVIGGPIDMQVVMSSAQSMTTLTSVIIACCAFSFLVGPHRIVHLIPRKLKTLRESTQVASNVLWRAPHQVRLLNEAQFNHRTNKFSAIRNIFPAFVSELVNQSTTHAGVADLRKGAISQRTQWFRFTFSRIDAELTGLTFSLTCVFIGIAIVAS